jgi:hypothetical protein
MRKEIHAARKILKTSYGDLSLEWEMILVHYKNINQFVLHRQSTI